jgi:hypothetical protein
MNRSLTLGVFLFFFALFCQAQNRNACDGPYVFYRAGQVVVQSIDAGGHPVRDSFPEGEKMDHPLRIHFSNHTDWDFTVRLRKEIRDEPPICKAPSKIFALSDIEGEFENFRALLIAGKVMDSLYHWTFGHGHLVICGDLFDRGSDVVPELWLLYKLEDEARAKGGYVHTLLGNHDIMNLSGDLRYIQPQYFEHAKALGLSYMDLYAADTELGRWLRSKNTIEQIGYNLYLHGGISPEILARKMTVSEINSACRPYYDQARNREALFRDSLSVFFGRDALFWYRGYFMEPRATQGLVDSTLAFYHCRRIIVGHTITNSNIADYYDHKVIALDVDEHEGHLEAILIENGNVYTVDPTGRQKPIAPGPLNPTVE